MSTLTIDQLKSILVSHGVQLPSPKSKKSEYLKLYENHVAPMEVNRSEFSSDEEESNSPSNSSKDNMSLDAGLVVDGVDVTSLDDDELFTRLKNLGATVGPIVQSTRRIYQRKLAILMGGHVPDAQFNGDVDLEDDYSDSEVGHSIAHGTSQIKETVIKQSAPVMNAINTEVRKRVASPVKESLSSNNEVVFDPNLHTPSPRRSLRSVNTTTTTTTTTTRSFDPASTGQKTVADEVDGQSGKRFSIFRLIVKICLFVIIFSALYYTYENYYSESPLIGLEHLARQALDAVEKQQAGLDSPQPQKIPPKKA